MVLTVGGKVEEVVFVVCVVLMVKGEVQVVVFVVLMVGGSTVQT